MEPFAMEPFNDRRDAGRKLALALRHYANLPDTVVLALPRGGVPVAYEVTRSLAAPLDVFVVRKLGVPHHEELAMGAIASGGVCVLNDDVIQQFGISKEEIDRVANDANRELARREHAYRDARPAIDVSGKTVILVDDGLATGATMRAAMQALRQRNPGRVVVAVPVAEARARAALKSEADEVVCLATPDPFVAVGHWYRKFSATSDDEVRELLGALLPDVSSSDRSANRSPCAVGITEGSTPSACTPTDAPAGRTRKA